MCQHAANVIITVLWRYLQLRGYIVPETVCKSKSFRTTVVYVFLEHTLRVIYAVWYASLYLIEHFNVHAINSNLGFEVFHSITSWSWLLLNPERLNLCSWPKNFIVSGQVRFAHRHYYPNFSAAESILSNPIKISETLNPELLLIQPSKTRGPAVQSIPLTLSYVLRQKIRWSTNFIFNNELWRNVCTEGTQLKGNMKLLLTKCS